MAVTSVERVDITLSGTSATAALTKGQDETKCVPFATRYRSVNTVDQNDARINCVDVEIFDNAGTPTVRCLKSRTDDTMSVTVYVVEFGPDVNVQQGTFTGTGVASTTAAISAVDLAESALVFHYQFSGGKQERWDRIAVRGRFTSTTQLTFSRADATDDFSGHWYVIEDVGSAWTVQSGTITLLAAEASKTDTITSVDTTKAFVLASSESDRGNKDADRGAVRVDLQDATTVRAIRGDVDDTVTVSYFVVEFDGDGFVQRGLITWGAANTQETAIVNLFSKRSSVQSPHRELLEAASAAGFKEHPGMLIRATIDASQVGLTFDRINPNSTPSQYAWEYVDWDPFVYFSFDFTADADFLSNVNVERGCEANLFSDADFSIEHVEVERCLLADFEASADVQLSTEFVKQLAHALSADAEFTQGLSSERTIAVDFDAVAEFAAAVGRIKLIAVDFDADADFQVGGLTVTNAFAVDASIDADFTVGLDGLQRRFKFSCSVDADFTCDAQLDLELANAFTADADFTLSFEREREIVASVDAVADFTADTEVLRPLAANFDALVEQEALLEIDDRLLRINFTATADFTAAIEVARPLEFAFTGDADFNNPLDLDLQLTHAFAADADFALAALVNRPLVADVSVDADFVADFDAGRNLAANVTVDADFTIGPMSRLGLLFTDFRALAEFQLYPTHDIVLALAFQADADFIENFVQAQRVLFSTFDADVEVDPKLDRQPGYAAALQAEALFQLDPVELDVLLVVSTVVEANFLVDAVLNELELALSWTAVANFTMEFETDRLPGGSAAGEAFVVPNLQTGAFVVPGTREFTVPNLT